MVGPSRPTITEIAVYTKYIRKLQSELKRRLSILVLGSTPEFRDWAFEENMIVTVMDYSEDYHNTISREIRHKTIVEQKQGAENFICADWLTLDAVSQYDIILGDLVIGNIPTEHLDDFLFRVSRALKPDGLFLGKSFFEPDGYKAVHPKELIANYNAGPQYHPYSALAFGLTMFAMENNVLSFNKQYKELVKLKDEELLSVETMAYFEGVGWENDMKFSFFVPKISDYVSLLKKHLNIIKTEYSQEIYAEDFPLYIVANKKSTIFGGK
jgi:hypothetical protein